MFLRFRRSVLALALLLPVACCLLPSSAQSNLVSTSTREGRLAVFDDAWDTINERYYDANFHGVDWQKERAQFRELAGKAQTSAEFYSILRRMIGALRDAHTRVFAPDEKFDWQRPRFISVGVSLREVGGQPTVISVEAGSEAERAGLREGDVILSIDGQPAHELFSRRLNELPGSSTVTAARLRAMATLFEGARDTVAKVVWTGADGKEHAANLRREWRERDARLNVRSLAAGYSVIKFDVFTQSVAADFMRLLSGKLKNARGLVIDLRTNGGGEAEAMTEVASSFLPLGKSLGAFTDRNGFSFEMQTRSALILSPDAIAHFAGPVVILTSERTSSAAEIFAATLKRARRASLIGTNTCGCVLAIRRRHTLPDGGELDVSEMDYHTSDGARLEGTGVQPDEIISLDRKDLHARRDRALERALEQLKLDSEKH